MLADKIPWDTLVNVYQKQMRNTQTGADGINPRVVIGPLIIKHMCDLSDRETVQQIQENMYMQYFLGFSKFSDEEAFDASLFLEFRKRLGTEQINIINEKILQLATPKKVTPTKSKEEQDDEPSVDPVANHTDQQLLPAVSVEQTDQPVMPAVPANEPVITHEGKLIIDATACPQGITDPTDLNLLSDAREKTEELIDFLYSASLHAKKPRTYREVARKTFLKTAQKKVKSKKEIRNAIKKQLAFVKRNIKSILSFTKQTHKHSI